MAERSAGAATEPAAKLSLLDLSPLCPSCCPVPPDDSDSYRVQLSRVCDNCSYCFCSRTVAHTAKKCAPFVILMPLSILIDATLLVLVFLVLLLCIVGAAR